MLWVEYKLGNNIYVWNVGINISYPYPSDAHPYLSIYPTSIMIHAKSSFLHY